MNSKFYNFILIITSLVGYLEWPVNNHMFLFQAEMEIISKIFNSPESVIHPFIFFPIIGQLILLYTLFQKEPNKILTFISIGSLGILLSFMFLIGILSQNIKILISTIPFLSIAILAIKHYLAIKKTN